MKMILALAALVAAGCAPPPADVSPSVPPVPPDTAEPDQCGAGAHQWLVGRQRSEIPPKPLGANWRVACTTCPITMDYSPQRMNIFYEERSGIVREVRCG